jgi:hypothetical protein
VPSAASTTKYGFKRVSVRDFKNTRKGVDSFKNIPDRKKNKGM